MLFSPATLGILILSILTVAVFLVLMVLVFRGLFQYIHAKDARTEKEAVKKSLGETLPPAMQNDPGICRGSPWRQPAGGE